MEKRTKCPVDPKTRELWLEQARAQPAASPPHHPTTLITTSIRWSLDNSLWTPVSQPVSSKQALPQPRTRRLGADREVSTIPRAMSSTHTINSAEKAALPANAQEDTGYDERSGNWIYPSHEMFFNAMKRKGHEAQAEDMQSVVPIHNAVNERAWQEIKNWEKGLADSCGGPKLVSFSGDSKALTPKARWNSFMGYQTPFDRHDWIVDRCGKQIGYVIDFYAGKEDKSGGKSLNFYLDVRPNINSWEGLKTRAMKSMGFR